MLTYRNLQVLEQILRAEGEFTFRQIANQLELSEKTVRNHLDEVHSFLERFQLSLVITPGTGSSLKGDPASKIDALREIEAAKQTVHVIRSKDRIRLILYRLLRYNQTCYIGDLEEMLFISRSSLYKDLKETEEWLSRFKISIMINRKKGITIIGGEKRSRLALTQLIEESTILGGLAIPAPNPSDFDEYLQSMVDEESFSRRAVVKILKNLEDESSYHFAGDDVQRLIWILLVSIDRIKNGFTVSLSDEATHRLQTSLWVKYLANQLPEIQRVFHIELCATEVYYLAGILLSSKYSQSGQEPADALLHRAQDISEKFAALVFEHCAILDKDEFIHGLTKHISLILQKAQYIWECRNPMKSMIKKEFPNSYRLAESIVPLIESSTSIEVPDDEVAYIAMHIMSGLERSRIPLQTIFIYDKHYSEIKFALASVKNHIHEVQIDHVVQESELTQEILQHVDLIFTSSQPKTSLSKPYFVIPMIPDKPFINAIQQQIRIMFETINDMRIIRKPLE